MNIPNQTNKLLYIGFTDDLRRRLSEHQCEQIQGYTKRYHIHKLVYSEEYPNVLSAIEREKRLKKWIRSKKIQLTESQNPDWMDLSVGIF